MQTIFRRLQIAADKIHNACLHNLEGKKKELLHVSSYLTALPLSLHSPPQPQVSAAGRKPPQSLSPESRGKAKR